MNPAINDIFGIVIGFIAVIGGLGIAAYAINIGTIQKKEEKIASIEAKNKERLKLIEKGMDPSIANTKPDNGPILLSGLLFSGIGFGAFIGYMISLCFQQDRNILIIALTILFGGVGLISYFIYRNRQDDHKA